MPPARVGKTELAKALSRATGRTLIRLQCYEGLDEAKALYEWNYRKQLLRIQTETRDAGWEQVKEDIFGEEFLLSRPLLSAISADEPVVLLIGADDVDQAVLQRTMSIIVKHRTDLDLVAERVGVKLGDGIVGAQRAG